MYVFHGPIAILHLAEDASCRSSHGASTLITEVCQTPTYDFKVGLVFQDPSKGFVEAVPCLRDWCEISSYSSESSSNDGQQTARGDSPRKSIAAQVTKNPCSLPPGILRARIVIGLPLRLGSLPEGEKITLLSWRRCSCLRIRAATKQLPTPRHLSSAARLT